MTTDFIATIFDEYGAGVWARDPDLTTAVQDAAKQFRMDFAGIYRLPLDFTFRVLVYDVRGHERVYVGATEVRCADTKQHIPVFKLMEFAMQWGGTAFPVLWGSFSYQVSFSMRTP